MMFFPQGDMMISQLNEQLRRIVISGAIREELASQFLDQITAFEFTNISAPVSIYISTYGGDASAALEMYDAMKTCAMPIVTIAMGKCMSAGTLIVAAGEKGSRFATQNCRFMIHQVSGACMGNMAEMENAMGETKKLQDIYVGLLSKETGVPVEKILADIQKGDHYMSAEEAIEYGLIDKIVPERKSQLSKIISTPPKKAKKASKR